MKRFVGKKEFAFSDILLEWLMDRGGSLPLQGHYSRRLDDAVATYMTKRIYECTTADESCLSGMRLHGPLALP